MATATEIGPLLAAGRQEEILAGRSWSAIRYFNLYRLIIAGLFAVLGWLGRLPPNFTSFDVRLFTVTACVYLAFAVAFQFAIELRLGPWRYLRDGQVLLDLAALTVIMHASGGVAGGFGILLVIAIAGACLLASWRAAVFFASLATLAVLGETLFGILYMDYAIASYTQAGLLGAACFGTATLASVLAERARRSEALAAQRAIDIEHLSRLNEHIVQRMRAGIVVLNTAQRVVLMNEAAAAMLRTGSTAAGRMIDLVSPALAGAREEWLLRGENRKTPIRLDGQGAEVIVSFTNLGRSESGNTLVFIEDAAESHQRAQQIKLASLGRLTASIAHEIRNPLGAISHAGQLLSESPELGSQDRRLTEIIGENSARVNDIIENVMIIGRRDLAITESFLLEPWLTEFVAELLERKALDPAAVECEWRDRELVVRMDSTQLHQVLWNLCENALRYSSRSPLLRFVCGRHPDSGRPYLEVVDTGSGMPRQMAEQVFEPFFTGEPGGTGLGLYIARELCEANQATLTLVEHGDGGCRFRLNFAHPDRQQLNA